MRRRYQKTIQKSRNRAADTKRAILNRFLKTDIVDSQRSTGDFRPED
jgi:hypothetical protein